MEEKQKIQKKPKRTLAQKIGYAAALVDFQIHFEQGLTALKIRNTHLKKNETPDPETEKFQSEMEKFKEKKFLKPVAKILKLHPAHPWFSRVKGIGQENIAKVLCFIDINKAPTISSLWKYAGYAVVDGAGERPVKGKELHFNKTLKLMCYRVGTSLIKSHELIKSKGGEGTKFGAFFEKALKQEAMKFESKGMKVLPTVDWKKLEDAEKSENASEYYVHMRAFRRMIKLFLGCLWLYWRQAEGLPIRDPYPVEKLGHTTVIQPYEMIDRD